MGGCSGRLQNAGNHRARGQAGGRSEPEPSHNAGRNTHPPQRAQTTDPATTDPPEPKETPRNGARRTTRPATRETPATLRAPAQPYGKHGRPEPVIRPGNAPPPGHGPRP
ncbi:hypothetical protein GCM10010140_16910 [Streptosporangium pseudovulgare]|uniref:Uncharacterized protein n=1 Tax=Streptosporangium pseudovulgare TaxID=35765 RepID=A0ABQ2QPR3_9ACTN|nr:hypothetical protein GCM10010140_16910 [Streptosporangium pseudovulgare]